MTNNHLRYRPEVDGLRALAVIPVIFFHAGFDWMAGGYVGVDVFFVISGYLITSILVREMQEGRFSLVSFYERRARRILPALFTVMAACLPFAWLWMTPDQLQEFAHSLAATSLFGANFLFWHTSDYFATAADLKPLLHTWSLAVEEQYYLFFPLAIMLLWRIRLPGLTLAVSLLALSSLVLSEWGGFSRSTNFYLLHTRAWELLLGSLLALACTRGSRFIMPQPVRELLAVLGLALIVTAMVTFDANTSFPGLSALVPTAGTALILVFGQPSTWTGKLLATRGLVGIGLVSYSAYLWHQPLFAFARLATPSAPSSRLLAMLSITALLLAWLSWRWVEQPFRDRKRLSRRRIFTLAAIGILLFTTLGLIGHWQKGFEHRLGAQVSTLFKDLRITKDELCGQTRKGEALSLDTCRAGHPAQPVTLAVLGDSHANALYSELAKALARQGRATTLLTQSACPPVRGVNHANNNPRYRCHDFSEEVFNLLAAEPEIDTLVLAARWTLYLENSPFDNREGGVESEGDNVLLGPSDGSVEWRSSEALRRELIAARIRATVADYLNLGRTVVLVYPIPEAGWHVPNLMARHLRRHTHPEHDYTTSYDVFLSRSLSAYEALDAIGEHSRLLRIYPEQVFCNTEQVGRCQLVERGKPLYFDDDHPSLTGARRVAELIADLLSTVQGEEHRSVDP